MNTVTSPGISYWNQRFALERSVDRILSILNIVDHPTDFMPFQFAQLLALALDFGPDLILELGRGYGNSTCAFTEAANLLPNPCRVVSLCESPSWEDITVPRLRSVVDSDWFRPLQALQGDILTFDFDSALKGSTKVLVFWDAHGFDIAECVLGKLLPSASSKEHIVALHDMSDLRYCGPVENDGEYHVWKGSGADVGRFCVENIYSKVPQAISAIDFTRRNRLTLESADHSIHTEIGLDPAKVAEMRRLLGDKLFNMNAYWFWFSMNEHAGPYHFPIVQAPD